MFYGKVIKAVFAAILLGLLLFLSNTGFAFSLGAGILNIFKPILFAASDIKQAISAGDTRESLENLRRESARAEIENLTLENNSLRKALRFSEDRYRLEGSRVVSYRMEFGKEFLFIERGRKEGVKEGDIVVDSLGFLAGVVKEATDAGSHVEVISNPGQTLEVLILPLQIRALAKGIGGRALALELLPQGTPIRTGDFVTLLGIGGVRLSLPLGEVASTKSGGNSAFTEARAVISTKPEILREVFVIK